MKFYDVVYQDGEVLESCIQAKNRKWALLLARATSRSKVKTVRRSKKTAVQKAVEVFNAMKKEKFDITDERLVA